LLVPYPLPYIFLGFGLEQILIDFGFECGYIGMRIRIGNGADLDPEKK
jgi:hypothetical protein